VNRRRFLHATLGGAAAIGSGAEREKAPFRMLYSSDTTHILTCTSPWHRKGEPLRPEMFLASVDESAAAGADAHLLQPGLGWVPWWPSRTLPLDEHVAWFRETFGAKASQPFLEFVLRGGDFVKLTLDRCRERGVAAFLSFRLNDAHHKDAAPRIESIPRFYAEHPEHRLGPQKEQPRYAALLQNWAVPEVREFKFRLIEELCRNYDLDGFELDFMRHPHLFRLAETTPEQRRAIVTEFVARVRRVLDDTRRPRQQRRWLSVRIPAHLASHNALGIDVTALTSAGVEMFGLSTYYQTEQQTSLAAIRRLTPAALYCELTQSTAFRREPRSQRRSTPEQLATTAHHAYTSGADGIALYNFQYYREQAHEPDPPASEPPFELAKMLRDPGRAAASAQHWFLGITYGEPRPPARPLPCALKPGAPAVFTLELSPPTGGWLQDGRLRIQAAQPLGTARCAASLNGSALTGAAGTPEPFPNRFTQLLGSPETLRAWTVPARALRSGSNVIAFTLTGSEEATIVFLDLAIA